jgi:hypothetical protein
MSNSVEALTKQLLEAHSRALSEMAIAYTAQIGELRTRIAALESNAVAPKQKVKTPGLKYDWDSSPTWAKYAAVDFDGAAFFFSYKPVMAGERWVISRGTPTAKDRRYEIANVIGVKLGRTKKYAAWNRSLQERPKP